MSEQVIALADELAEEFPASRDALRLFASTVREQSAKVAVSSQRGPAADQKSTEAD
jgi:hypothetical protein